ncbi:MAG: hypothetical protein ABI910_10045 [Gemmatimonadota bacterium]
MTRRVMLVLAVVFVAGCDDATRDRAMLTEPVRAAQVGVAQFELATGYSLQVLPSLQEGRYASAIALNGAGLVVGVGDVNGGKYGCHDVAAAIVWSNASARNLHAELAARRDIGFPPPGPSCAELWTMALDVNDLGDVIVASSYYGDNQGWMWNSTTGFAFAGYGGRLGGAVAMNNRSELVGYIDDGNTPRRAALWMPAGSVLDIDPRDYGSTAFGISDDGDILGCVRGQLGRWKVGGQVTVLHEICGEDLGVPFGLYVRPIGGIARDGTAALSASRNGVPTALVWRRGTVTDAGWSPGSASDISERGRVVGWAYATTPNDPRAVTRLRNGAVQWLPTPTANTTSRAFAVNRCGDVAGYVVDAKGFQRGAVWRVATCDNAGTW